MPYRTFLAVLRAEGLTVIEETTGGRPPSEHNRDHKGAWGPVNGVMIHHTVTRGHDSTVEICRKGYASLPGPLCHGVICKQGHVHVVGYGRANHAGLGDDDVLRAVINEAPLPADNEANTDGNRHFYGFECENLGDGHDPWPAVQLEAIERAAAAVCRHHGWNERSVIGHLEWQPGKVDPRGFTMASMRGRVADRLDGKPTTNPPKQEETDMDPIDVWAYKGKTRRPADGGGRETRDAYEYLRGTNAAVKALTAQVGALTATVGTLAKGGGLDAAEIKAAAEAGAQAALAQLGDALKEG
ncbi:N-acetylmuramoyl-L-alanine amidase [Streptomyces sp. NPDC048306]|uniref:N-acetylmuramoyl-L-alanine amidase n=1 Tax=Streptomyces sp. NPDC048306 TaxID=3154502 RepID=UPI0033F8C72B